MTPSDIYTLLIIIIVVQVVFLAWIADRLSEARKREREAVDQLNYERMRATRLGLQDRSQGWSTRA